MIRERILNASVSLLVRLASTLGHHAEVLRTKRMLALFPVGQRVRLVLPYVHEDAEYTWIVTCYCGDADDFKLEQPTHIGLVNKRAFTYARATAMRRMP